jgi:hypothetical protein
MNTEKEPLLPNHNLTHGTERVFSMRFEVPTAVNMSVGVLGYDTV